MCMLCYVMVMVNGRVRWGNTDRGGTPTECSGTITISNCAPPLTTNTTPILSEQHASNRFPPSRRLCLPGKKIYFSDVCYFSRFSYSVSRRWIWRDCFEISFITIFSHIDMLSSEMKCVLSKWPPWHCCEKKWWCGGTSTAHGRNMGEHVLNSLYLYVIRL